jgi:hypothetical protein
MRLLKMLFRRWIHSLSRLNIPWGGFFISVGNLPFSSRDKRENS